MTNPHKHAVVVAYIFGIPGLLGFLLQLGLGLVVAMIVGALAAGLVIGLWARPRLDAMLENRK